LLRVHLKLFHGCGFLLFRDQPGSLEER
jgi:hypothetical protein